jgi:DNA-binding PadR family transcriptional regulator
MADLRDPEPAAFLPLPAATFHILMAVAEEDRHGYAIVQAVARRTGGELRLSAGTLYRSIQRMLEQGLLVEIQQRPLPEFDDERQRYYRITALGAAVARAKARPRLRTGEGVMALYRRSEARSASFWESWICRGWPNSFPTPCPLPNPLRSTAVCLAPLPCSRL